MAENGGITILETICYLFSMENGQKVMTKLTDYSQFMILIILILSFVPDIYGYQLHPYATVFAVLAARNKKYTMTTIAFGIWILTCFVKWFTDLRYYNNIFYLCTFVIYCVIALFAAVAWRTKREK